MTDLILPDSRLEMPELFDNGRKPVGNVKVDLSNDLTIGLRNILIFNRLIGCVEAVDYERNTTSFLDGESYNSKTGTEWLLGSSEYSIAFGIHIHSITTGNSCVFSVVSAPSFNAIYDHAIWVDNSDYDSGKPNVVCFHIGNNTRIVTSANSIVAGEYYNIVVTLKTGVGSVYINGVLGGQLSGGSAVISAAYSQRIGKSTASSIGGQLDADIDYMYLYDRYISPTDAAIINKNPYQFLIPA